MSDSAENTAGKQRGRPFMPGQSGNPAGKPLGARNKVTLICEGLMGPICTHQVTARVVKRAAEGDMVAARRSPQLSRRKHNWTLDRLA
jgi:hypothetical protein